MLIGSKPALVNKTCPLSFSTTVGLRQVTGSEERSLPVAFYSVRRWIGNRKTLACLTVLEYAELSRAKLKAGVVVVLELSWSSVGPVWSNTVLEGTKTYCCDHC